MSIPLLVYEEAVDITTPFEYRLYYSGAVGAFQVGEVVTGTSFGSAVVTSISNPSYLVVNTILADFIPAETVTGGTSGAHATILGSGSGALLAAYNTTYNIDFMLSGLLVQGGNTFAAEPVTASIFGSLTGVPLRWFNDKTNIFEGSYTNIAGSTYYYITYFWTSIL